MERQQIYEILNQAYFSADPHEREILDHLTPLFQETTFFVDVGASLGQYTYFASQQMKAGRIYAIEADPVRFDRLRENCQMWAAASGNQITAISAAACDQDSDLTFFTTQSNASGGLFPHAVAGEPVAWHEIVVAGRKLDTLLKGGSPDFVKIDVEGVELRVLRGAAQILKAGKARFLVELHAWKDPAGQQNPHEVISYMQSFGYGCLDFYGHALFVKETALARGLQRARRILDRCKRLARRRLHRGN
jgi:FkbM family methyltransferase